MSLESGVKGKTPVLENIVKKCQRLLQVTHEGMNIVMIPVLSNFSFPLSCSSNPLDLFLGCLSPEFSVTLTLSLISFGFS